MKIMGTIRKEEVEMSRSYIERLKKEVILVKNVDNELK